MKTELVKPFLCLLGLLCALAQGQAEPTKPPREQSLAARGTTPRRLVPLRIVGSNVKNAQGQYLGRIEEAAVNPATGQIEFAILQIYYPTNTTRVTPIPWKVLSYVWDQSQAGGAPGANQTFHLNMTRAQLERAPTLGRNAWPDLSEAYWAQRIFSYFGVEPDKGLLAATREAPVESATSDELEPPGPPAPSEFFAAAGASGGGIIVSTNGTGTNPPPFAPIPPGATNQLFNTNIFLNRTNFFQNRTNFFLNRTNFFPGTRQPFNPNDPSTFPRPSNNQNNQQNNQNQNVTPSTPTTVSSDPTASPGASPFTPNFQAAPQVADLPPPVSANSPWSPLLAGNQADPNVPVQPQPNPWGPRFLPPGTPNLPVQPQPGPWSPRFLPPGTDPPNMNAQPNPWGPRFSATPPVPGFAPPSGNSAWASGPAFSAPPAAAFSPSPGAFSPPLLAPRVPLMRAAPAPRR
jgi:hypothetical protein